MARYSIVLRRMWDDVGFRSLSSAPPNAQTLWMRLLTGPELGPIPGAIRARASGLAEALGWDLEPFRERFRELAASKPESMAKADWEAGFVFLPKAIIHNPPANPNVVKSWRDAWDELPECPLKLEAYQTLKRFVEPRGEPFAKAFAEAVAEPSGKGSGNQEQEQEQEQDDGGGGSPPSPPPQLTLTNTAPDPPQTKKKNRKPRSTKLEGETRDQIAWRVWRELYLAQYGAAYTGSKSDPKAIKDLATAAENHAKGRTDRADDHEGRRRVTEEILRHWIGSFLEDPGHNGFLVSNRHPVRCIDRDLPKYGLPWSRHREPDAGEASDRPDLVKLGGRR